VAKRNRGDAGYDMQERASKMLTQGKRVYHYSAYWGTWSRILVRDGMWTVEVDLTPVNGSFHINAWMETRRAHVRKHCTMPHRDDIMTDTIPPEIRAQMVSHMGEVVTQFLLTDDDITDGAGVSLGV